MDKYSLYVLVVYAVTFVVLFGYPLFVWSRLRQEQAALEQEDRT